MTQDDSRQAEHAYRAAVGRIAWFRGAFAMVIGRPCSRHGVDADVPCWLLWQNSRAVCGARIRDAGLARGTRTRKVIPR
jgi:hypothetical protein